MQAAADGLRQRLRRGRAGREKPVAAAPSLWPFVDLLRGWRTGRSPQHGVDRMLKPRRALQIACAIEQRQRHPHEAHRRRAVIGHGYSFRRRRAQNEGFANDADPAAASRWRSHAAFAAEPSNSISRTWPLAASSNAETM